MHTNGRHTVHRIEWCSGDGAIKIYLGYSNISSCITKSQVGGLESQTSTDLILVNVFNSIRIREFRERDSKVSCFKVKYIDYD